MTETSKSFYQSNAKSTRTVHTLNVKKRIMLHVQRIQCQVFYAMMLS